jgi:hypothetical protein
MPNHCENDLLIRGPYEDRDDFMRAISSETEEGHPYYAILANLYPCPEELLETCAPTKVVMTQEEADRINEEYFDLMPNLSENLHVKAITEEEADLRSRKYGGINWYDWCISHWGTKWGDYDLRLSWHSPDETLLTFCTAWSPPEPGIALISKKFPTLTFSLSYYEAGMGFSGNTSYKDGVIVAESYNDDYKGPRGG